MTCINCGNCLSLHNKIDLLRCLKNIGVLGY